MPRVYKQVEKMKVYPSPILAYQYVAGKSILRSTIAPIRINYQLPVITLQE